MVQVFRPIPVERLKLLVFDLDGTLIDSAQDLCNSVNAALGECSLGPLCLTPQLPALSATALPCSCGARWRWPATSIPAK
ncbi:MAG: hypothetical protein WDM87_02740 [Terracidiphilus sp.]